MRIGTVAQQSGVPVKTIRYYEQIGLLPEPARSPAAYRDYTPEVLTLLRFIRASQTAGLSLGEIREILAYRDRGEAPCAHVLELLRQHSHQIDERIDELQRARTVINGLVARASTLRTEDCSPTTICHLIPRQPTATAP